jgi:RNA polymerase sigma-54 factor
MLKQRLQQKLQQKLSPQQIQMIKLLEIPAMQLEQRIKEELEINPVLEEGLTEDSNTQDSENNDQDTNQDNGDEFTLEDYLSDDEYIPSYKLNSNNYSADDKHTEIPFSVGSTFHEFLETQLGEMQLDDRQLMLASYIIGNIDDDGYLRRRLDAIVDDVAFLQNIQTTEVELIGLLRMIQEFEPTGVGARDLQECLLLQIEQKNLSLPHIQMARKIVKLHFEEFTRKHYDKIITRLGITENELKVAIDEILKLNPKPGSAFSDPMNPTTEHITPDFMLEYKDGNPILTLNAKNIPELRISRSYAKMLESYVQNKDHNSKEQKETINFVKQKLDSARWFIDAIKQRQNTLLHTMQTILNYQSEYFKDGDEKKLRPMILKDVADVTGLDISTISRVANSKYIQTHFGILPLKFFFSEGMQNGAGEEISTREIKKILEECLENEDKRNPVTDDELAIILKEKGYPIARRTVAKYREQLDIPVARLRKELKNSV